MDLSKEFIQYQIDNPHNLAFKTIISYEDREDTIDGFKRLLNEGKNKRWISIKDRLPDDNVEVLFLTNTNRRYVWKIRTHVYHDGTKSINYRCITARGSDVTGLKPIAWSELPE